MCNNDAGEATKKSGWFLVDSCHLYLQHIFKDEPWLLWESGETSCAAQNSHAHHSIDRAVG